MAKLLALLEQHLDRQPPTVVIQATIWWEALIALVNLQECGLVVYLPVKVCYMYACEQWRQPFIVESIFCMRVYVQMHKIIYYFGSCALGRCMESSTRCPLGMYDLSHT